MTKLSDTERFLQELVPNWRNQTFFAHTPGGVWTETRKLEDLDATSDCYVSIGAFDPACRHRRDGAREVAFLVVDDVGDNPFSSRVSEAEVEKALGPPTKATQTSLDNQQWFYKLSAPVAVGDWGPFARGVEKRIGAKLDTGYTDPVHVYRLPMGVNTKPERGGFAVHEVAARNNPSVVLDVASITPVGEARAARTSQSPEGKFKHIRRLVALVPNSTGYHAWIARMYQIWVLAEDKAEGREAWLEFCERWTPPPISARGQEYDPADKWDRIREGDTDTLGQLLLDDARAANPDEFARIMAAEAAEAFDDGVVPPGPTKPAVAGITATPFKWVDLARTAPRDWLYGDILLRKFISITVAPGGVGKSSLVAVETLAQVTGKSLLGEDPTDELRVWLWNLEDPYEETQKRLLAAAKHYGVSEADIGGRLYVDSGRDQRLVMAEVRGGTAMIVRPVISALVEQIRLRGIDVVVIDPFVSCHGVPENDNTAMDMVVKEWGRVAEEGNCAVHLVDHTNKSGSQDVVTLSSRGAVSKTDAARVVRVVNRMTAADGKAYGGIVDTWRYFNTFNDKANMAPPKARRDWFRMESVWAGNGGGATQAFSVGAAAVPVQGDSIGVAVKWTPPDAKTMATGDGYMKVVAVMKASNKRWQNSPRSPDWVGFAVAQGLQMSAASISERAAIKSIIDKWISDGLFRMSPQDDKYRKSKEYIEIADIY